MSETSGMRFRRAVDAERPLQVVGVINAYCARLAERAGFRALYLSGAGVANASFGLPDLGMTSLTDVLEDARRITAASSAKSGVYGRPGGLGGSSVCSPARYGPIDSFKVMVSRTGAKGCALADPFVPRIST